MTEINTDTTEAAGEEAITEEAVEETIESPAADAEDGQGDDDEAATFPREYVKKLRTENARYRERARSVEIYSQRLHTELVRATGRLADPSDLPFDEGHLDDPEALDAALEELVVRKPHLASRRPVGEIGQGATYAPAAVDLASMLRQRAR